MRKWWYAKLMTYVRKKPSITLVWMRNEWERDGSSERPTGHAAKGTAREFSISRTYEHNAHCCCARETGPIAVVELIWCEKRANFYDDYELMIVSHKQFSLSTDTSNWHEYSQLKLVFSSRFMYSNVLCNAMSNMTLKWNSRKNEHKNCRWIELHYWLLLKLETRKCVAHDSLQLDLVGMWLRNKIRYKFIAEIDSISLMKFSLIIASKTRT